MSALAGADQRKGPRAYLWAIFCFALGYILAVAAGSIILAVLLQFAPNFEMPHLPHGGTTVLFDKIMELTTLSFLLGSVFGLPYTILGSLAFWFLLPRRTVIFLLIGTFCPTGALVTMGLFLDGALWWEVEFVLMTLPAGLAASYVYGAIGFRQGFGRWRFA